MTDTTPDMVELPRAELAGLEHLVEQLEDALQEADATTTRLLAAEDQGWSRLVNESETFNRDEMRQRSRLARLMSVADPLIRRGVNLRAAYVWGDGVKIAAADPAVDEVVQEFLDAQADTYHGAPARAQRERAFATDGFYALALPTDPLTGNVQARRIPADEVEGIISNPNDRADVWFVRRSYRQSKLLLTAGRDSRVTATTREEKTTVYHPALGVTYSSAKPRTIDGHPIDWDTPVLLTCVNEVDGYDLGVPDVYASLSWAQGYRDFLLDWAKLTKALSKFAFQVTGKGSKATQARAVLAPAMTADAPVGQTMITGTDQQLTAIGKSGATINSESGRPLAAMVASALDLPVTMLLADPGVTGARATAETLDRPLHEVLKQRRAVHHAIEVKVLDWVIQSSMRAPRGALRGRPSVDLQTGRQRFLITSAETDSVDVDFPPIEQPDVSVLVQAVKTADDTGKLPPLEVLKLLIQAFGIDNGEDIVEDCSDDDGNWVDPVDRARATSQTDGTYQGRAPGLPPVPDEEQPPVPPRQPGQVA